MLKILTIYKPVGFTPFEIVKIIKQANPKLSKVKMGYAGRLDPLAHGVLLLMIGDETKNRDYYLSLPKTYEFEVVFGVQTDTYDVLGIIQKSSPALENVNLFVNKYVNQHIGKSLQTYPPYSSKTVHGKPLFWWARQGKLSEIEMPTREIEIFDFLVTTTGNIEIHNLKQKVMESLNSVHGDFRQEDIKSRWELFFKQQKNDTKLLTAKFKITCSSGTYIRELINKMGQELDCGAVAINIFRTSVGEYTMKNALIL